MTLRGKIRYYQERYSKLFTEKKTALDGLCLEEILELRLCDLKASLQSSLLKGAIAGFEKEWLRTPFSWKPSFWLADEWFHLEGTNGIAIPFYLSNPKLMAIEEALFQDCEGKSKLDILKYLRHEAGHIIDKAYQFRYDRTRQSLFGRSSEKYPKIYYPVLYSTRFVKNLPCNYAQTHPDEDFAETFAIWMNPKSQWKKKYSGTVLKKLKYIDAKMQKIKPKPSTVFLKDRVGEAKSSRMKLKTYYKRKAKALGVSWSKIEKQIYQHSKEEKVSVVKALVLKYAKSKALTNYEMRYLLSSKHSPLLRKQQLISYLKNEDQVRLKRLILKTQKNIEKKGIYFST